jgi:ribosome production factor 1
VSHVKNKQARSELFSTIRKQKNIERRKRREARKRLKEELGENAPPMPQQRTLDNTREPDDTMVAPNDEEVQLDTAVDEFSDYFTEKTTPKILITTCLTWDHKGKSTISFIKDLVRMFPNMYYRPRKRYKLTDIVEYCKKDNYTDIIVINEDRKRPHSLILCHLPYGPTAFFRLTSIVRSGGINNRAKPTQHFPELILNNFNTRLGYTVGRMFAALLPPRPEFEGRRVMTFHNQRDYIFFRQHRYIFDSTEKARIQEIGPRFCLKLKSLQHGTFDSDFGEYEWVPKKDLITSRRRFFL